MSLFGGTQKNARAIGTALLIITFVAGSLAGAAAVRVLSAESHAETAAPARPGAPPMRGSSRKLLLDESFAKELGLTDAQRTRIKEILDRRDVEAKKMWDGFEPQLKHFGQRVHSEIAKVLTAEQREKLDAALAKHHGEHKRRHACHADTAQA